MNRLQIEYRDKSNLAAHPYNMRSVVNEDDVRSMADSIREKSIIQPLVGVPDPQGNGRLRIVVGHVRLLALEMLGDEAPLAPVIVREDLDERAQLEMMTSENVVRFNVVPISEALHYKRQMEMFGTSQREIAAKTGVSLAHIGGRLRLLRLQPPVRELIARGELPIGAGESLLTIEDPKLQADVANRLAQTGSHSLKHIAQVTAAVLSRQASQAGNAPVAKTDKRGLSRLAMAMEDGDKKIVLDGSELLRIGERRIPFDELNVALQATCAACVVGQLETMPRWGEMLEAAERTCQQCGLSYLQDACDQCPVVDLLRHLYGLLERRGDGSDH